MTGPPKRIAGPAGIKARAFVNDACSLLLQMGSHDHNFAAGQSVPTVNYVA